MFKSPSLYPPKVPPFWPNPRCVCFHLTLAKLAILLIYMTTWAGVCVFWQTAWADGFYYAGYTGFNIQQAGYEDTIVSNYATSPSTNPGYFPLAFSLGNKKHIGSGINLGVKWFNANKLYYVLDFSYASAASAVGATLMGGAGLRFAINNSWSISPFGMIGKGHVASTFANQTVRVFGGARSLNLGGTLGRTYMTGDQVKIETVADNITVNMLGFDIERPWPSRIGLYIRVGWLSSNASAPSVKINGRKTQPSLFFMRRTAFASDGSTPNFFPFRHVKTSVNGPVFAVGILF